MIFQSNEHKNASVAAIRVAAAGDNKEVTKCIFKKCGFDHAELIEAVLQQDAKAAVVLLEVTCQWIHFCIPSKYCFKNNVLTGDEARS